MKWPASITLVRHAQSAYNELREKKEADAEYAEFRRSFERDPGCEESRALAERVAPKFALGVSDFHTPLTAEGKAQAERTGRGLDGLAPRPDDPQGESVSQVRDRCRSFTTTLIREHAGEHVLVVTHHLTILSFRANYERLTPEEFLRMAEQEKPLNCGVTLYRGDPEVGSNGRLVLDRYNVKLY